MGETTMSKKVSVIKHKGAFLVKIGRWPFARYIEELDLYGEMAYFLEDKPFATKYTSKEKAGETAFLISENAVTLID